MAWIYLAASEDCHLPYTLGCGQLPIVKTIGMLAECSCPECMTYTCPTPLFGMMSERLITDIYHPSTLSMEDFHVRTSALQAMEQAWAVSEADFFTRLCDLPAKQKRRLSSLKTCQPYALEDFERCAEHLPSYGMIVAGHVYLPEKLAPHTCASGGFFLPTPTAHEGGTQMGGAKGRVGAMRSSLGHMATHNTWPTPKMSDWKHNKPTRGEMARCSPCLPVVVNVRGNTTGQLNPQFVEWLMNYPIGWTELSVWATQWCPRKRAKRFKG